MLIFAVQGTERKKNTAPFQQVQIAGKDLLCGFL